MTIKEAQVFGKDKLKNITPEPDFETDIILKNQLLKNRVFLYANPEKKITKKQRDKIQTANKKTCQQ